MLDDGSERTASVTLLYFKGWPDMTVPGSGDDSDIRTGQVITKAEQTEGYDNLILNLVNFYKELHSTKPLVHCR